MWTKILKKTDDNKTNCDVKKCDVIKCDVKNLFKNNNYLYIYNKQVFRQPLLLIHSKHSVFDWKSRCMVLKADSK